MNLHRRPVAACGLALMLALTVLGVPVSRADLPAPPSIWVREGYALTVVANLGGNTRFMAGDPQGRLYVSYPGDGKILRLCDTTGDGTYDEVKTFVTGHNRPQAMQWHDDWLWFADTDGLFRARDPNDDGVAEVVETIIANGKLPGRSGHWWRSLLITGDRLYTSVGDSGNITDEPDSDRQKIWSYNLKGEDRKLFVTGIRNTEKLVVRPGTDEIWGMDHGSDNFGGPLGERGGNQPVTDLNPPDEMNHYVEGGFYGHPYITGNRIPRYEYMKRPDILELAAKTIPPAWMTPAHNAPNAMCFYTGTQFPAEVVGDAFVAFHGSWNSSKQVGCNVSRVLFDHGKPYGSLVYVSFQANANSRVDRPVDVMVAPDGTLLISGDQSGRIYRLRYVGKPAIPAVGDVATPAVAAPPPPQPAEATRIAPTDGRGLAIQNCAPCHGPQLQGTAVGTSLVDGIWKHGDSPAEIRSHIADGIPGTVMPAWRTVLSDEQLTSIVDYLTHLPPAAK